jgi:hypothetical protein
VITDSGVNVPVRMKNFGRTATRGTTDRLGRDVTADSKSTQQEHAS